MPVEFLLLERPVQEWVALRNALAHERITAEFGEPPVSTAKAEHEANLDAVTAAWRAAVGR